MINLTLYFLSKVHVVFLYLFYHHFVDYDLSVDDD